MVYSRSLSQMLAIVCIFAHDSVLHNYSYHNLGSSLVKYDVPGNRKKRYNGSSVQPVSPMVNVSLQKRPLYNRRSGDHGYSAHARREHGRRRND